MVGRRAGVWFHYAAAPPRNRRRPGLQSDPPPQKKQKPAASSHRAKHAGAMSSGRQALYAQLNGRRETAADSWAEQQTQHLIEHLRQSALIHEDPVAQTPSRARWQGGSGEGGRGSGGTKPRKKRGHVLPSGGEDGGRLALREADPLSKYLMSFRTVGLFQPLHLQNNSHYVPRPAIMCAFRAPKKHRDLKKKREIKKKKNPESAAISFCIDRRR